MLNANINLKVALQATQLPMVSGRNRLKSSQNGVQAEEETQDEIRVEGGSLLRSTPIPATIPYKYVAPTKESEPFQVRKQGKEREERAEEFKSIKWELKRSDKPDFPPPKKPSAPVGNAAGLEFYKKIAAQKMEAHKTDPHKEAETKPGANEGSNALDNFRDSQAERIAKNKEAEDLEEQTLELEESPESILKRSAPRAEKTEDVQDTSESGRGQSPEKHPKGLDIVA